MIKKFKLIFLLLFMTQIVSSQILDSLSYDINLRFGAIILDKFYDPIDKGQFQGSGMQSNVMLIANKEFGSGRVNMGIGYSHFNYFTFGRLFVSPFDKGVKYSNFLNILFGYQYYVGTSNFSFDVNITPYFLLEKKQLASLIQKVHLNGELGVSYDFNRFQIKLSTPLSITPMFKTNAVQLGIHTPILSPWVEQTGLILTIGYRLIEGNRR